MVNGSGLKVNVSIKSCIIEAREGVNVTAFTMENRGITPVLTAGEMRKLDDYTIHSAGTPSHVLMENAAKAVLAQITRRIPSPTTRIGIFCGTGNNGGDGMALGHLLWRTGRRNFKVFLLRERKNKALSADAQHYHDLLVADGPGVIEISEPSLFPHEDFGAKVDALFGTGLDRQLSAFWISCINSLNALPGGCIAVDCPSGLNCTTGEIMGAAVAADYTVTFGHPKAGFYKKHAQAHLGEVIVGEIGLASLEEAGIATSEFAFPRSFFEDNPIPPRKRDVHKGDFGRVLIVAGSHGFSGAAKMCATSASRAGAGLVRLYVPAEIYVPVASGLTEVMTASFDSKSFAHSPGGLAKVKPEFDWADFIALGSGLSLREDMQDSAYSIIANSNVPLLADAEGCYAAKHWLLQTGNSAGRFVLLTPHMGEFARLAEIPLNDVASSPEEHARQLAASLRCWILLKSSSTFLATPSGHILRPPPGAPALAKGGSGDVLAGAVASRTAIAVRAAMAGDTPYTQGYLAQEYYAAFPMQLQGEHQAFVEGVMRGYAMFAEASHSAAKLAGSEESVFASEVAELINVETDWRN